MNDSVQNYLDRHLENVEELCINILRRWKGTCCEGFFLPLLFRICCFSDSSTTAVEVPLWSCLHFPAHQLAEKWLKQKFNILS